MVIYCVQYYDRATYGVRIHFFTRHNKAIKRLQLLLDSGVVDVKFSMVNTED